MMDTLVKLKSDECLITGGSAGGKTALVVALPQELSPVVIHAILEGVARGLAHIFPSLGLAPVIDHITLRVPDLEAALNPRRN